MITITLSNYRCFGESSPLKITLGQSFTALVGPNNSGKSAFLRFIYEFQQLWGILRQASSITNIRQNNPQYNFPHFRGVKDVEEILNNQNGGPICIKFIHKPSEIKGKYLEEISIFLEFSKVNKCLNARFVFHQNTPMITHVSPFEIRDSSTNETIDWNELRETFENFENCLYAPAFRNAINQGASSHFDLAVGTALVKQWDEWKAGSGYAAKRAIRKIEEEIAHIFGFDSLLIDASSDNTSLNVEIDRKPYSLNDVGSGIAQFVILFANLAVRKPALLLLDEPELNLHPALQLEFLTSLATHVTTGKVVFATHSLGLARVAADAVYALVRKENATKIALVDGLPDYAEFAGEMSFGSFREMGFEKILLVEGPTEVRAIKQFLSKLDLDAKILLLPLGGDTMINGKREYELGELKRVCSDVSALIDSEKEGDAAEVSTNRKEFKEICEKLGFKCHVTQKRAFENYFPDEIIKNRFGGIFRSLKPYEDFKMLKPRWQKEQNWILASEMSKEEILRTDIGQFLNSLS